MKKFSGCRTSVSAVVASLAGGLCLLGATSSVADGVARTAMAGRELCVHGVSGNVLNVRGGPGLDKPVVATFRRDDCGLSLAGRCEAGWCEMQRGDIRGWVDTRYVGVYEMPAHRAGKSARAVQRSAASRKRATRHPLSVATRPGVPTRMASVPPVPPTVTHGGYIPFGGLIRMALGAAAQPHPGYRRDLGACVVGVAPWDTLRVRSGPGVAHAAIGAIPNDACRVHHVGVCKGQWCRVAWRGRAGWVNTFYLE